jgi:hypothetical protein
MATAAVGTAGAAAAAAAGTAAAAAAAATGPAPELAAVRLGPKTCFYAPAAAPRPPAHPVAVVVCAWMDAAPRHIAKYVAAHRELYPATCILVVTVSLGDFMRSSAARCADMDVAVATLRDAVAASTPPSPSPSSSQSPAPAPVLVHVFSNGGCLRLHDLASRYRATAQPQAPLPAACVVFDSAPGAPQYRSDVVALMASVPQRPRLLRLVLAVLVRVAVLVLLCLPSRMRTRVRNGLNDPALLSRAAPRCYIYSAEDDAVDAEHVEAHAFEASRAGLEVATHRFHGSGHVAHMRLDPVRYWDIVRRAWDEAVR